MIWLALLISQLLFAEPPRQIPPELYCEYTLGGIVPVLEWYHDDSRPKDRPIEFNASTINSFVEKAKKREFFYYIDTDLYLYALLDQYSHALKGKSVAIIGSLIPWYESIVLAYGGIPFTIEYNRIECDHPLVQVATVSEFEANPRKFDAIFCISSIEHDGLGRYGDPLNPDADLETMQKLKNALNENGFLFLAIPVGSDAIYWNAHRVYGRLRLPLLFKGWEVVQTAGFSESDFSVIDYTGHQPVFLLKPL